ncbi:hypothetical protein NPIL_237951 [Nephila pilipes]|uniref:Uncharacterized protein n=1 Tax=Nephila pilipes TaxID=299642 RepID=A0A8X6J4Q7_NEPPI|nr:hypothetical protein NPIL_237951 [Nephila pilipes]
MHPTSRKKLVMSELNKRNIRKRRLIWKQFKTAIFIVCVACFSWQSANFFELYFTYPTTTNIDITYPEVLIKPAATLCNTNPWAAKCAAARMARFMQPRQSAPAAAKSGMLAGSGGGGKSKLIY